MEQVPVLENVRRLPPGETFRFRCHPGVPCFTDCCRQLDLALTPYDVLRLRRCLGLNSARFLDRYALLEQEEGFAFPHVFLAMESDEGARCPFVGAEGCRVYADRPSACRTYPLGRGAVRLPDNTCRQIHVLLQEPHCRGFEEGPEHDAVSWSEDQALSLYNAMNDEIAAILQHPQVKQGLSLSPEQADAYLLALYRLDLFREMLLAGTLSPAPTVSAEERRLSAADDIALLRTGIRWLRHVLFEE